MASDVAVSSSARDALRWALCFVTARCAQLSAAQGCNDPALPAQVMPLKHMPQRVPLGNVRYSGPSASCSGAIAFTPEAGRDYELGFSWQGRTCRFSVNQVVVDGAPEAHLVPVPVVDARKC